MPSITPPSVIRVNTAPHIVGTLSTVVLPAFGAGTAIRVLGGYVGVGRTTAAAIVDQFLRSTTTSAAVWQGDGFSIGGQAGTVIAIPEPGVLLPANEGLTLDSISTAATGLTTVTIYFHVDTL